MGQPMEVTVKPTLDHHVKIFETNRWLTGMGSGNFSSAEDAPEGSMARMILDSGDVTSVHVYGNTITVTKKHDAGWDPLADTLKERLENFLIYYPENIGKKIDFSGEVEMGDADAEEGEAS